MHGQFQIHPRMTAKMRRAEEWPEPQITIPFAHAPDFQVGDIVWIPLRDKGNHPFVVRIREHVEKDRWSLYVEPRPCDAVETRKVMKMIGRHHRPDNHPVNYS